MRDCNRSQHTPTDSWAHAPRPPLSPDARFRLHKQVGCPTGCRSAGSHGLPCWPASMPTSDATLAAAEKHRLELLNATSLLRTLPVTCAFGHCGPWLEDFWIDSFMAAPIEAFGGAIPLFVQWLPMHRPIIKGNRDEWRARWGVEPPAPLDIAQVVDLLREHLKKTYVYVTVAEHDWGVGKAVMHAFPNLFVLGASEGHVILPLLKQALSPVVGLPLPSQQPYAFGFAGSVYPGLRAEVLDTLKQGGVSTDVYSSSGRSHKCSETDWWPRLAHGSRLGLAPRGVGRSSFRLTELVELGIPPVYIWDDLEWLPYRSLLRDAVYSVRWQAGASSRSDQLFAILQNATGKEVLRRRRRLRQLQPLFKPCGVIEQISCLLAGRPTALECVPANQLAHNDPRGCRQRFFKALHNFAPGRTALHMSGEVLGCEAARTCEKPRCPALLHGGLASIVPDLTHLFLSAPVSWIPSRFLRGLKLQVLRLECGGTSNTSGQLRFLPRGLLDDQPRLRQFYAGHNQLESVPTGFFEGAPGLLWIHLAVNLLQEVPETLLQPLNHLRSLYIGGLEDAPLTRQADGTPVAHFLTPIHRRRQPISIGLPSGWPHAAWMRDECHWGHHFEAHLQKGWVRCYMCFAQTTDGICRW